MSSSQGSRLTASSSPLRPDRPRITFRRVDRSSNPPDSTLNPQLFRGAPRKAQMGRTIGPSHLFLAPLVSKVLHLVLLHVAIVLAEGGGKLMRAIVAADEIQIVHLGRMDDRF